MCIRDRYKMSSNMRKVPDLKSYVKNKNKSETVSQTDTKWVEKGSHVEMHEYKHENSGKVSQSSLELYYTFSNPNSEASLKKITKRNGTNHKNTIAIDRDANHTKAHKHKYHDNTICRQRCISAVRIVVFHFESNIGHIIWNFESNRIVFAALKPTIYCRFRWL